MPKFNIGDILYTTIGGEKIPANVIVEVFDYAIDNSRYCYYVRSVSLKTEEWFTEESLVAKKRVRHICPECGIDYHDEDMKEHLRLEHGILIDEHHGSIGDSLNNLSDQAEAELMEMDRIQRLKAEKYDKICGMLFIATGVVDDGDSIKYITDPESVCDELLRIIIEDENLNIEKLLETKKRKFKEITLW